MRPRDQHRYRRGPRRPQNFEPREYDDVDDPRHERGVGGGTGNADRLDRRDQRWGRRDRGERGDRFDRFDRGGRDDKRRTGRYERFSGRSERNDRHGNVQTKSDQSPERVPPHARPRFDDSAERGEPAPDEADGPMDDEESDDKSSLDSNDHSTVNPGADRGVRVRSGGGGGGNRFRGGRDGRRPEERPQRFRRNKGWKDEANDDFGGGESPREDEDFQWQQFDDERDTRRGKLSMGRTRNLGSEETRTRRRRSPARDEERITPLQAFLEDDTKLSKLVRRIVNVEDRDRRLAAARQLQEYVDYVDFEELQRSAPFVLKALSNAVVDGSKSFGDLRVEILQCLGNLGGVMMRKSSLDSLENFFDGLFERLNSLEKDEWRVFHLEVLSACLRSFSSKASKYQNQSRATASTVGSLMSRVQVCLENAETASSLIGILGVIDTVVALYPHVLCDGFQDIVDILVGWHIDTQQRSDLIKKTSDTLISMRQFWMKDMDYSLTLIGQFLEDLEEYQSDISRAEDKNEIVEATAKIGALINVFTTVLKCLGDDFSNLPGMETPFVAECLDKILPTVTCSCEKKFSEENLVLTNRCVTLFVESLQKEILSVSEQIGKFFIWESSLLEAEYSRINSSRPRLSTRSRRGANPILPEPLVDSFLTMLTKTVEKTASSTPQQLLKELLGPSSVIPRLKLEQDSRLVDAVMEFYTTILSVKSPSLLEEAYSHIVGELQVAFNTLLLATSEEGVALVAILKENPHAEWSLEVNEAQVIVIFNLYALTEMGNHKNSFMGMWALRPSLFSLFSQHLRPSDDTLARHFPSVFFATLKALEAHSQKHGHFLTSTSMVLSEKESSPLLANMNPSTSTHLNKSIKVLTLVFENPSTSKPALLLCLDWTNDVFEAVIKGQMEAPVFRHPDTIRLFMAIINLARATRYEDVILATHGPLLLLALHSTAVPVKIIFLLFELAKSLAASTLPTVSAAFLTLLKAQPLYVVFSSTNNAVNDEVRLNINQEENSLPYKTMNSKGETAEETTTTTATKAFKNHVAQSWQGNFHALNFRVVMGYILFGHLEEHLLDHEDWLEWLFHSCQRDEGPICNDFQGTSPYFERDKSFLWNWACWETAHFCIVNKLRSPLGKALDTFTAVENILKVFALQLKIRSDAAVIEEAFSKWLPLVSGSHQRVHSLTLFVDHLEKQLYNAYEGCASAALPAPSKLVRTFFRTNKSSCQEWIHRNRLTMMIVSLGEGNPYLSLWHGNELLREMAAASSASGINGSNFSTKSFNTQQYEQLELAMMLYVKALINVRAPGMVLGLYQWCKKALGKKFSWIRCLAEKAGGQEEQCCQQVSTLLMPWLTASEKEDFSQLHEVESPSKKNDFQLSPGDQLMESLNSLEQGSLFVSLGMDDDEVEEGKVIDEKEDNEEENPIRGPTLEPTRPLAFLGEELLDSYLNIGNWSEYLRWSGVIAENREKVSAALPHVFCQSPSDASYVSALSAFAAGDASETCRILANSEDGTSSHFRRPAVLWSHEECLRSAERETLFVSATQTLLDSIHGQKDQTDHVDFAASLLDSCISAEMLRRPVAPTSVLEHRQRLHIDARILECLRNPEGGIAQNIADILGSSGRLSYLEPETSRLRPLLHLLLVAPNALKGTKLSSDHLLPPLSNLRLCVARLCRKQRNPALAQELLIKEVQSFVETPGISSEMKNERLEPGHALPKLLEPLRAFCPEMNPLHFLTLTREICKLMNAFSIGTAGLHSAQNAWGAPNRHNLTKIAIEQLSGCLQDVVWSMSVSGQALPKRSLDKVRECISRSLLNLAKWCQQQESAVFITQPTLSDSAFPFPSLVGLNLNDTPEASSAPTLMQNIQTLSMFTEQLYPADYCSSSNVIQATLSSLALAAGASGQPGDSTSSIDHLVASMLNLSTVHCRTLAKSWFTLAGWSYKKGRKTVDASLMTSSPAPEVVMTTTKTQRDSDRQFFLSLLPTKWMTQDEVETALGILEQVHFGSQSLNEDDVTDQDQSLYVDGAEAVKNLLLSACPSLRDPALDERLQEIVSAWRRISNRLYGHYQVAAEAYFKYLKLISGVVPDSKIGAETESDDSRAGETISTVIRNDDGVGEEGAVTATLRLLRLLVKHAGELRSELEVGLAKTPTLPWRSIVPQLFSRLNHPEPYVRRSITELLCRIAADTPHLIVYPAVVGSQTISVAANEGSKREIGGRKSSTDETVETAAPYDNLNSLLVRNISETEEKDYVNKERSQEEAALVGNSYASFVDTLAAKSSSMIAQVQLFVAELRRITLLWDELWLGTLNQNQADLAKCIARLESELKKVNLNPALSKEEREAIIREKHQTIMKPVLYVLKHLRSVTVARTPQTPHEEWFQKNYKSHIDSTINQLEYPSQPHLPTKTWQPIRLLHQSLQQRAQRKAAHLLDLRFISPALARLCGTTIPMPGIFCAEEVNEQCSILGGVYVARCDTVVSILPTKTKPKKLVFFGSDGKKHAYLFKGLEDLHLDERIMQFLSIVNTMFSKSNNSSVAMSKTPKYFARHYSVTPLGSRSGLIQWVDGATPLFGLYKRWQQREAAFAKESRTKDQQGSAERSSSVPPPSVPRPTEIYYNKLNPALKELGISATLENRKEWPLQTLKKVLEELINETPSDLLSRELWCSSAGAAEWWTVSQNYARSSAVMSVIGYVIGLGDRHLDNVLIDISTGEVVHIDYNVCFEKGKSLRVPERVPFRMTQNLETALGVTGVEGTFRVSCEHVMKTLRKGKEILLTLLEAFVYDPLVDWTLNGSLHDGFAGAFYGGAGGLQAAEVHATNKQEMERDINISMFDIRVAEMKSAWTKNGQELSALLLELVEELSELQDCIKTMEENQQEEEVIKRRAYLVSQALRDKDHQLNSLKNRFSDFFDIKRKQSLVTEQAKAKLKEFSSWSSIHQDALTLLLTGQAPDSSTTMSQLYTEASTPISLGIPPYVSAIEFLQSAGQSHTIQACEESEGQLTSLLHNRQSCGVALLNILQSYQNMISRFPKVYLEKDRCNLWKGWLRSLLEASGSLPSVSVCLNILQDFKLSLNYDLGVGDSSERITGKGLAAMAVEDKLKNIHQDTSEKYGKITERMKRSALEQITSSGRPKHSGTDPVSALSTQLSIAVTEAAGAITFFTQENAPLAGALSLSCVLVTALLNSCKKVLEMEKAASMASSLVDLTSMTGTWFLEELCSISSNIAQMVSLLKDCSVGGSILMELHPESSQFLPFVDAGVNAVTMVRNVFLGLQELLTNFKTIILPESLKCFLTEEITVIQAAEALSLLLRDCDSIEMEFIGTFETKLSDSQKSLQSLNLLHQSMQEHSDSMEKLSGIDNLIKQVEQKLMCVIIGVQVPTDSPLLKTVTELRTRFDSLMKHSGFEKNNTESNASTSSLTPGQMLLMGFNGLFEKLETDAIAMYKAMDIFGEIPENWRKVDIIKEGRSLQKTALNSSTVEILQSLFFLRRLKAMQEFFDLAILHSQLITFPEKANISPSEESTPDASSFFTPSFVKDRLNKAHVQQDFISLNILEQNNLAKPVKAFIAEFVRKQLLGLSSQTLGNLLCVFISMMGVEMSFEIESNDLSCKTLDELCKKAVEAQLKIGVLDTFHLSRGSVLITGYDSAWRKRDLHHRTEATLADFKSRLQQAHLALSTFRWVHDDVLSSTVSLTAPNLHTGGLKLKLRQPSLTELQHKVHAILAMEAPIAMAFEKHEALEQGIVQRLKWAAGANPNLVEVLSQFEATQRSRQKVIDNEKKITMEIVRLCNAILHFESFRSTSQDAKNADTAFLDLLQAFHHVAQLQEKCHTSVSLDEEALLKAIPMADDTIISEWLSAAKDFVHTSLQSAQDMKSSIINKSDQRKSSIKQILSMLKLQLATHHKLISEVRAVLKNLSKYEEQIQGSDPDDGVRGYLSRYKKYSENLAAFVSSVGSISESDNSKTDDSSAAGADDQPDNATKIGDITNVTLNLIQDTPKMYESLIDLAKPLLSMQTGVAQVNQIAADDHGAINPETNDSFKKVSSSATTNRSSDGSASVGAQKIPIVQASSNQHSSRDPRTGRALQERNSYAVGVWRRVKLKLEGRDPDSAARTTVADQVDWIIKEATSVENLALLYEGWTPWV